MLTALAEEVHNMDKGRRQELVTATSGQWGDIAALAQGFIPQRMAAGKLTPRACSCADGQQASERGLVRLRHAFMMRLAAGAEGRFAALLSPRVQVTTAWCTGACCACSRGCASAVMPATPAACRQGSLQPATQPFSRACLACWVLQHRSP